MVSSICYILETIVVWKSTKLIFENYVGSHVYQATYLLFWAIMDQRN